MSWITRYLPGKKQDAVSRPAPLFLTNTLSGKKESFIPLKPGQVTLYSCGPTVYGPAHIGNLRAYVFSDTLARTLEAARYHVRRVINITDVGHLVADGDEGEDKMTVAALREHSSPSAIADRYTSEFIRDLGLLGVDTAHITFPRATEYIREQIALAETLEQKGFAYRIAEGLYFDTSRFPGYGKLGNLAGAMLKEGARVAPNTDKRNPSDFALWRYAKPGDLQTWDSPWGVGNPGWHLECSAMTRALLGPEIDIHTGGEDHIHIHHNNEIAQSEGAQGRPFVRYWMHNAFLTMHDARVAKSTGNVAYLSDVIEKGFHPLALRYFFLQAHYRTPSSFSWDGLASSAEALSRLWRTAHEVASESERAEASSETRERFLAAMRDDLSTPQALGILWDSLRSEDYAPEEKWGLLKDADTHLGLSLTQPPTPAPLPASAIPKDIAALLAERESARKARSYDQADALRTQIENRGYLVEDGPTGPVLTALR